MHPEGVPYPKSVTNLLLRRRLESKQLTIIAPPNAAIDAARPIAE